MKKSFLVLWFAFLLCTGLMIFPYWSISADIINPETKGLIELVNDAAALIEKQGEVAFEQFKVRGSKWLHDEKYIFVIDTKGFVYINPQRPELQNTNQLNLKDLMGKPFIQSFIKKATGPKKSGWVHYVWFKPAEENPMWKTSYVKLTRAPSGKEYIVGSGLYNMKMERIFAVDAVEDAANLILTKGKDAFKELKDPLGDYNFLTTYVFVIDSRGNAIINPAFPGFEGQNVLNLKDAQGKYFIKDMINSLEKVDTAWIDYLWPKPRQMSPSKKTTYVKKIVMNNEVYYIGSGIYLD